MKRIIILIFILIIILFIVYIGFHSYNSNKDFKDIIKYKTASIYNGNNLNRILENLYFKNYMINIDKEINDGKEHLTFYYDCTDETNLLDYYKKYHQLSLMEKNSVVLFALIDNLETITYQFDISNTNLAKKYHLNYETNNKFEHTRENIEKYYNQDVRNYIEKPNEFLNYNIDLKVKDITIYYKEFNNESYKIKNLANKDDINNITEYIRTQNFGIRDDYCNCMCTTWLDLNNGYIIGVWGSEHNNYGAIIKGNGKDIFLNGESNYDIIYKLLPIGLTEYVENIIKNN